MAPPQGNTYIYVAGFAAGFVGLVVLICLLCFLRRSKDRKRINLSARDMVQLAANPSSSSMPPPPFSRHGLTASIIMPQKSITRQPAKSSFNATVTSSQHEPSPASSTPSPHRPPSSPSPSPHCLRNPSILNPASPRHSRTSSGFSSYVEYPSPPGLNSRPSSTASTSSSQAKHVWQLFESSLPDELALTRYGERLTVLRSFDDGWCLVARDTSRSSRLSVRMASSGHNVDIGLVPAWVFVKPLKGIAVTRPFRNTSINALHLGQNPTYGRDAIYSWSNFG